MKLTYDQIINILLLTIIIILLFNMSDKKFFNKLYNFSAEKINLLLNEEFKIKLISHSESYDTDAESICNNEFLNNNLDITNIKNENKNSDSNKIANNEIKDIKKSSASFYYSENLEDKIAEQIYDYFQTLTEKSEISMKHYSKKYKSSNKQVANLIKFLQTKINSNSNFNFSDIKILNNVLYFSDEKIVEIQPIIILMNYHFIDISKVKTKKFPIEGQIKIQIELYFEFDDPENVFVSQNKFANRFGVFKISRISIIEFNKKLSSEIDLSKFNDPKNENDNQNKNIIYNLSDSEEYNEVPENIYKNEISENDKIKNKFDYSRESLTFHAENYSETLNSIIPEKIDITDNSPQTYSN